LGMTSDQEKKRGEATREKVLKLRRKEGESREEPPQLLGKGGRSLPKEGEDDRIREAFAR